MTNDPINRRYRRTHHGLFYGDLSEREARPRLDWLTREHYRRLRARQWAERRALMEGAPR